MVVPLGNVLVTSASSKAPLIRAAQQAGARIASDIQVIAGDIDAAAPAGHVADGFWHMPRLQDGGVEDIIQACLARNIRVILPTRDGELLWWAERRAIFDAHKIAVIVSNSEAIRRCTDKLGFAEFGVQNGLPVIAAETRPIAGAAGRFVVKERFGAGSEGLGLNLSADDAIAHAATLQEPVFQSHIAGPEISIDAWMDENSDPKGVVLRRRDRVVHGESQITTTFRNEPLQRQAHEALVAMDLFGPVVLQAIVTGDTSLAVIEINARFGGASTTSIAVGLDSLFWSLETAFTGTATQHPFLRADREVRQVRLPSDMLIYDPDL